MGTEKQGEKPKLRAPAPTTASSDQPDQSSTGEGQCKTLAFSLQTSRHEAAPAWMCCRCADSSELSADTAVEGLQVRQNWVYLHHR